MPYLQPTVRQLQPLGRRHHSSPAVPEEVGVYAHTPETVSPNAETNAAGRRRWPYRLRSRAALSS